jgi:phenylpyruvate tautomerase PptA (4-oxalocrotonate tautomerase family)
VPIVTVEIVQSQVDSPAGVAQSLADAIGRALQSPPGQTWVRVRGLPRAHYAENESTLNDDLPVFVTVMKRQLPPVPELAAEIAALTAAIAQVTRRPPERVHVEYAPAAAGRMAFGGRLIL